MLQFKVHCEWKGQTADFTVTAKNKDIACDVARAECKKRTGLPPSSIQTVAYVGSTQCESFA